LGDTVTGSVHEPARGGPDRQRWCGCGLRAVHPTWAAEGRGRRTDPLPRLAHICRGSAGGRTGSALNQCDVGLPVDRPRGECARRWTCIPLFVGDLVVARRVRGDRALADFRCART